MIFKKITYLTIVLIGSIFIASKNINVTNAHIKFETVYTVEPKAYKPIVVLELFTSQGCSSCPPADALLDKVKSEFENRVIPMSYHVDYWNYIGWKDPFSKSKYTEKQRKYNMKFKNHSNYTPQVVVNGQQHFVGSDASKLYSAINSCSKINAANKVDIKTVNVDKKTVLFEYAIL